MRGQKPGISDYRIGKNAIARTEVNSSPNLPEDDNRVMMSTNWLGRFSIVSPDRKLISKRFLTQAKVNAKKL